MRACQFFFFRAFRQSSIIFFKVALLTLFFTLAVSGCASNNGNVFHRQKDVIDIAYDIAGDLTKQAFPPLIVRHPNKPILMTTFVNSNNLNETSHFSRILQENVATRFVQLGYTVRETKLRSDLHIEENSGEMILSRNLKEIQPSQKAQAISLGTYALNGNMLYVTAKLVSPGNANIISSVDYKIRMDDNMLAMFGLQLKRDDENEMIEEPEPSFMTQILY